MRFDVKFSENSKAIAADMSTKPQNINAGMGISTVLHDGQNGATFIPAVSDDGVLSWTNDRGLDNPAPASIKGKDGKDGADGDTPVKGKDYFAGKAGKNGVDGRDGYTPVKGIDYFDGVAGKDGRDGNDGYTPIKGKDYFDGVNGKDGSDGYTPQKGVDYFDGKDGKNGADGQTPEKGVDYFTAADKQEMVAAVIASLPVYSGEVVAE